MMKCDYHIHSTFSDGQLSVCEIVSESKKLGLESIAITDHYDPYDFSLVNREVGEDDLLRHLDDIRREGIRQGLEVFAGIEAGSDMQGNMRISDRILDECDIVICSPHYVDMEKTGRDAFDPEYWDRYKTLLLAQALNDSDIAGHPEGYLPAPGLEGTAFSERQIIRAQIAEKFLTEDFYQEYGKRLAKAGKAFEIHGASGTPRKWVIELLSSLGVIFSIGSDAHDPVFLGKNQRGWQLADEMKIETIHPLGKRRFQICRE